MFIFVSAFFLDNPDFRGEHFHVGDGLFDFLVISVYFLLAPADTFAAIYFVMGTGRCGLLQMTVTGTEREYLAYLFQIRPAFRLVVEYF